MALKVFLLSCKNVFDTKTDYFKAYLQFDGEVKKKFFYLVIFVE